MKQVRACQGCGKTEHIRPPGPDCTREGNKEPNGAPSWKRIERFTAVECPECGYGATNVRHSERDNVTWGRLVMKQYRQCSRPSCGASIHTYYPL